MKQWKNCVNDEPSSSSSQLTTTHLILLHHAFSACLAQRRIFDVAGPYSPPLNRRSSEAPPLQFHDPPPCLFLTHLRRLHAHQFPRLRFAFVVNAIVALYSVFEMGSWVWEFSRETMLWYEAFQVWFEFGHDQTLHPKPFRGSINCRKEKPVAMKVADKGVFKLWSICADSASRQLSGIT
ncbi:hypothetical protein Bca4012_026038 [Brassica carinata]|uniref:Uncharacterized protein n=1 Tax=Brassica carinata TaxID=52824 RepID=A0A8X7VHW1_BRACI|nr:hypothetical protein Bca52824_023133 [Brassica carinata]